MVKASLQPFAFSNRRAAGLSARRQDDRGLFERLFLVLLRTFTLHSPARDSSQDHAGK